MNKIGILVVFLLLVFACSQKPSFPLEPSIGFDKISVTQVKDELSSIGKDAFKDSVSISISYRDGDGDLGVSDSDIDKNKGEFNFIVRRFVRVKGVFIEFNPIPAHSGNFVPLRKSTKPGPIEGIINYAIDFQPLNGVKKDTIKFEIQIVDRAKNLSNTVMTDSVLVNELNKKTLK